MFIYILCGKCNKVYFGGPKVQAWGAPNHLAPTLLPLHPWLLHKSGSDNIFVLRHQNLLSVIWCLFGISGESSFHNKAIWWWPFIWITDSSIIFNVHLSYDIQVDCGRFKSWKTCSNTYKTCVCTSLWVCWRVNFLGLLECNRLSSSIFTKLTFTVSCCFIS